MSARLLSLVNIIVLTAASAAPIVESHGPVPTLKSQPRVVMLTHTWRRGTLTYIHERANELVPLGYSVLVVECAYPQGSVNVCHVHDHKGNNDMAFMFTDELGTYAQVVAFFGRLDADLVNINFLHYTPTALIMDYFSKEDVPFTYTLHDHHPIVTGIIQEMSMTCEHTANGYAVLDALVQKQKQPIARYATVLRRAMMVSTPSYSNKLIYRSVWSQLDVAFVPNRAQTASKKAVLPEADIAAWRMDAGTEFRVVAMGELDVSKGAHILQNASMLASSRGLPIKFHLVGAAYWMPHAQHNVVDHGPYSGDDHAIALIKDIKPHAIWFPATRHESFCYVLDIALATGLPIIASTAGSFKERLLCHEDAWVFDMCQTAHQWLDSIMQVRQDVIKGLTSTTLHKCQKFPDPDFETPLSLQRTVFHALSALPVRVPDYEAPWVRYLAAKPGIMLDAPRHRHKDRLWLPRKAKLQGMVAKQGPDLAGRRGTDGQLAKNGTLAAGLGALASAVQIRNESRNLPRPSSASQYVAYASLRQANSGCAHSKATRNPAFTKAIAIIHPGPSDLAFHTAQNFACKLGPGWNVYVYCDDVDGSLARRFQHAGHNVVIRPGPSGTTVEQALNTMLMSKEFWAAFHESDILVSRVDAIVARPGVDQFVHQHYAFIGAPGSEGAASPRGNAMSGGLSLRKREAMLHCLHDVTPEAVNAYRRRHGLHVLSSVPNSETNASMHENTFFTHASEMLGLNLPSTAQQARFASGAYFSRNAWSLQGYLGGLFTTGQLQLLLYAGNQTD